MDILGSLRNKVVLVSGAGGFVGCHLGSKLSDLGCTVVGISSVSDLDNFDQLYNIKLTDQGAVLSIFRDVCPDVVVHLASNKKRGDVGNNFMQYYKDETSLSFNIIEAALVTDSVKKFVFLGSCDEYGMSPAPFSEEDKEFPLNSNGVTKATVSTLLCALNRAGILSATVLRPSVIYGPEQTKDMFIPAIISSLLRNQNFEMTTGNQERDFIYIDDVISAIINSILISSAGINTPVNIASGLSISIKDTAILISQLIGNQSLNLVKFGEISTRDSETSNYSVNIELAKNILKWTPEISFEDGLTRTISSFRQPRP